MTVHKVYALPQGGEKARATCGYTTRNPRLLAVGDTRPEDGCRNCWRETRTTPRRMALLDGSAELDPETIQAILEDRPTNHIKSPKAA